MEARKSVNQTEANLLFGSEAKENDPIIIILNEELMIQDINLSGAIEFFNKNKKELLKHSFLSLLREKKINTKPFVDAFQNNPISYFKFEHPLHKVQYSVAITATQFNFSITMFAENNAYMALKSYVNAIIDNMPGAVYWKNKEGLYIGCNKFVAEMAGYTSPEDIIGKSDYDLCWAEFAEAWQHLDKTVMEEGTTIVREEKIKLANGKILTELTFKSPLRNEHNQIVGIIGTSLDITERKEIEAALHDSQIAAEAANRAKSEFIRNMEHQLRTPFSGVYSIVEMLFEAENDPEKRNLLEVTYQSAKEFLELLNKIIDFSRNQQESTPLLNKKFDLKKSIGSAVTMEKAASSFKNLSLVYDYHQDLPTIFIGDPHRIQQLVLNLVDNAIKFTQHGEVKVDVRCAKQVDEKHYILQIIITDTGIGIDEEKQQYIYEKFYRLHPANQNTYKGAGLGLYIVKKIIDELGGEIDVSSVINKGTTFICTLPFQRPLLDEVSP